MAKSYYPKTVEEVVDILNNLHDEAAEAASNGNNFAKGTRYGLRLAMVFLSKIKEQKDGL